MVTLITVFGLLAGVALGWYLRSVNTWCPQCGDAMSCAGCGKRPSWSSPGRNRPPVR
ncbi:hypothetical protein Val02_70280 [Virgisporangium aliadipatigenens]|uniref:FeoB-associated Cys-rich membrane protein n=1 Tax=Virgisporangium aliadipatigenens TaxID=741659 RepID=A0A8J4DVH9_9ACTN|nr:hypothetical protein [Virgisporangium aliadipatigenens]GIJ50142.1 hypothetical protein Val02_70280 [Virgisporangium aliadipatigenens]